MGDARAVRCGLPPREGELRDEEHPGGGRLRSCEPGLPPRVRVARLPPLGRHGGQRVRPDDHFVPVKPFSDGLFPTETHKKKVWISAAGVLAVIGALTFASTKVGFLPIFLLYVLPYMACNFWLVLYTWLQHTDVDVPHFNGDEWDWVKGTFMTIDRPYGPVLDFLHHRIGSTHVAHHVAHTIPHYHAKEATEAL